MSQLRMDKVILICLLFFSIPAFALPGDTEKPLQITADSSLINYKTGVYVYEGNVKINQGTTQLTADRVITKNNTDHKLKEAIAYGINQLAEYITTPREGDDPMHAQAKTIKFYPPTSTVVLEDNVIVTQGENSVHGTMIIYNIKTQVVTAPAMKNGRATILVEPKKYKKS